MNKSTQHKSSIEEVVGCIAPLYDPDADRSTIAVVEEDLVRKVESYGEQCREAERVRIGDMLVNKFVSMIDVHKGKLSFVFWEGDSTEEQRMVSVYKQAVEDCVAHIEKLQALQDTPNK